MTDSNVEKAKKSPKAESSQKPVSKAPDSKFFKKIWSQERIIFIMVVYITLHYKRVRH